MKTKGKAYLLKPGVIMKKWILMLFVMVGMVSEMMATVKIGVDVKLHGKKKWKVIVGTGDNCPDGRGICMSIEIKIGMDGLVAHYPETGEVTIEVAENSEFIRTLGPNKILEIGEDSPSLDILAEKLKYPRELRIRAGNYRPELINGVYVFRLRTF